MFKKLLIYMKMKHLKLYKESIKILKQEDVNDCFVDLIHNRFIVDLKFPGGYITIRKTKSPFTMYKPFSYKEIEEDVVFALDYLEDEFNISFTTFGGYTIKDGIKNPIEKIRIIELDDMSSVLDKYGNTITRLNFWFRIK